MKTILITISLGLFCTMLTAQKSVLEDSLALQKNTAQSVVLRCGTSFQSTASPMYVIDGIPYRFTEATNILKSLGSNGIVSIDILKEPLLIGCYGSGIENGVVLITTINNNKPKVKVKKVYPFKVYEICNTNWANMQDVYNAIDAKVPGVSIPQTTNVSTPNIRMRGSDKTIVIVDGVRYDASILATLNADNIESVKVSHNPAAQNYFINE